jgi:hypothetical protein
MTYAQGIAQLFPYVDFHLKTKIVSPLYLKSLLSDRIEENDQPRNVLTFAPAHSHMLQ